MATGIPEATVEEVRSRTDLADLISSYGIALRRTGSGVMACCPFHHEKTPSFHVNTNRNFYHCFGCGESGDAIKFVQKMDGLTFPEAVRRLAEQCGVKIEEKEDPSAGKRKRLFALMAELAAFYHRCLKQIREAQIARDYLASRDLDERVQDDFLIGYAPSGIAHVETWAEKHGYTMDDLVDAGVCLKPRSAGDRGYHRFGGRLIFSIRDKQGRVVAFSARQLVENRNSGKYVNSPETLIFKKSNVLFGFDKASGAIVKSPHREAIVCEGQIDTIRLHVSGFPVAVASQGTAFTEEHVRMLKKVADQVVLVFDDDGAGHKATIRTAGLFLAAEMPVRVVSLPNGDDPDSYLRTHPKEDFQRLLDNAESIMHAQVRMERAKEAKPDTVDAVARITRAVIATIAQSANAVLRAGMVGEAAELLGLPSVALQEELEKVRREPARPAAARVAAERPAAEEAAAGEAFDAAEAEDGENPFDDEPPMTGCDAAAAEPPPPREFALMEFLMANEYDGKLDGMAGEFLPPQVFAHDFTRRFVETWRTEVAGGEDRLVAFAAALPERERAWFDRILLGAGRTRSSGLEPVDILQDFIRALWADALKRRRGDLPAAGDAEAEIERMRLSMDIKRLASVKWHAVKEIVREHMSRQPPTLNPSTLNPQLSTLNS